MLPLKFRNEQNKLFFFVCQIAIKMFHSVLILFEMFEIRPLETHFLYTMDDFWHIFKLESISTRDCIHLIYLPLKSPRS